MNQYKNNLFFFHYILYINIMEKEQYYSIEEPDKLIEYINNNLTPNKKNKKERGEVFTPIELVKEMLDKLPKEVWSNPHLKWLDPAVGIGNFPVVAYLNLMEGLREWESNEEKRRTHILENMLYMVEINKQNIIILNKLLCGHKYKLNIFEGSFVDGYEYDKVFSTDVKFDIIMGNPPYNDKNGLKGGGHNLYTPFLNKSIDLLDNEFGEIIFITPISIFKTTNEKKTAIFNKINDLHINYINFNDAAKYFNVGSTFCYYNLSINRHENQLFKTLINDKIFEGSIYNVSDFNWLPLIPNKETYSILNKSMKNKLNCNREDNPTTLQNKVFFKRKNYINYKKPSFNPEIGGNNIEKYVITIYDSIPNRLKNIQTILDSNLFKFIYININYDGIIYHDLLNLFGMPNNNIKRNPTDQDIYDYYGITKQEQQLIEEVVNDTSKKNINKPDKLIEYINNNLTPNEKNKKERGEVFTPIELVKEMLDKLPKEVWSNPHLKWLDPAVGIGNFPVVAYLNLMEGLREWESNEEKRRTHILENMLYMVEINKQNIIILNKLLCGHKYKLNIFEGSFVDGDQYEKVFSTDVKFDIIMGNPPYNKGGVGKGGGVFWTNFVFKSIEIINNDGYLCFIHPLGWRKPFKEGDRKNNAGRIFYEFKKSGYLHYIYISDEKIPHFPKVDYYIYHNSKKIKKTLIYNKFKNNENEDEYEINHLRFIPNFINNNVLDILNKLIIDKGEKINIIYNQSFKIIRDQSFKPNNSHIDINGIPHAWTPISQKEYKIAYNSYPIVPQYIKQPKIILTYKSGSSKKQGKLFAKYYQNNIGTTSNTMYQIVENKKEGNLLEKYFNSKLITFLLKITQYTDGQYADNQFKILNLIKKPEGLPINPTDQDIYDYYGITKQEQQLIEEVVIKTI